MKLLQSWGFMFFLPGIGLSITGFCLKDQLYLNIGTVYMLAAIYLHLVLGKNQ